jgi:hypothetical protein
MVCFQAWANINENQSKAANIQRRKYIVKGGLPLEGPWLPGCLVHGPTSHLERPQHPSYLRAATRAVFQVTL